MHVLLERGDAISSILYSSAHCFVCLVWCFTFQSTIFQFISGRVFPGWTNTKQGLQHSDADENSNPQPLGLKSNALPLRHCMVNDDACGEQLSPVTTKIALNGSTLLNMSATRALDKKSHPEPLVQIQNNFSIFLMLPSTMIDQNIQLDWTT